MPGSLRIYIKDINNNIILDSGEAYNSIINYNDITNALNSSDPVEYLKSSTSVSDYWESSGEYLFPFNDILGYTDISGSTEIKFEKNSTDEFNFAMDDTGYTAANIYVIRQSDIPINTTWKQIVYDAADAYRTASATETQVKVGELATKISSLEDVTAEVTAQTPIIDSIMTELTGKVLVPSTMKISSGKFSGTSDVSFNHNLGVIPDFIFIGTKDSVSTDKMKYYINEYLLCKNETSTQAGAVDVPLSYYLKVEEKGATINETSFIHSSLYYDTEVQYYWIALAITE